MLGDPGFKELRLSPWRLNLHTKSGREGTWEVEVGDLPTKQTNLKKKKYLNSVCLGL